MKKRRTKEEVLLEKINRQIERDDKKSKRDKLLAEKNARKHDRIEGRARKIAEKEAKKKPEPTEEELVKRYANRTIRNQQYHGRVDSNKFQGLEYKTNTKNLWRDTDFYFSVVFQSSAQRNKFLEHLGEITPETHGGGPIKIINGLKFAKKLGIELQLESAREYPTGNLDLMPYVLDDENLGDTNGEET